MGAVDGVDVEAVLVVPTTVRVWPGVAMLVKVGEIDGVGVRVGRACVAVAVGSVTATVGVSVGS